jgi:hypothetical protein
MNTVVAPAHKYEVGPVKVNGPEASPIDPSKLLSMSSVSPIWIPARAPSRGVPNIASASDARIIALAFLTAVMAVLLAA